MNVNRRLEQINDGFQRLAQDTKQFYEEYKKQAEAQKNVNDTVNDLSSKIENIEKKEEDHAKKIDSLENQQVHVYEIKTNDANILLNKNKGPNKTVYTLSAPNIFDSDEKDKRDKKNGGLTSEKYCKVEGVYTASGDEWTTPARIYGCYETAPSSQLSGWFGEDSTPQVSWTKWGGKCSSKEDCKLWADNVDLPDPDDVPFIAEGEDLTSYCWVVLTYYSTGESWVHDETTEHCGDSDMFTEGWDCAEGESSPSAQWAVKGELCANSIACKDWADSINVNRTPPCDAGEDYEPSDDVPDTDACADIADNCEDSGHIYGGMFGNEETGYEECLSTYDLFKEKSLDVCDYGLCGYKDHYTCSWNGFGYQFSFKPCCTGLEPCPEPRGTGSFICGVLAYNCPGGSLKGGEKASVKISNLTDCEELHCDFLPSSYYNGQSGSNYMYTCTMSASLGGTSYSGSCTSVPGYQCNKSIVYNSMGIPEKTNKLNPGDWFKWEISCSSPPDEEGQGGMTVMVLDWDKRLQANGSCSCPLIGQ